MGTTVDVMPGLPLAAAEAAAAWIATFALAGASFRYIEQTALALKARFSPSDVRVPAGDGAPTRGIVLNRPAAQ